MFHNNHPPAGGQPDGKPSSNPDGPKDAATCVRVHAARNMEAL